VDIDIRNELAEEYGEHLLFADWYDKAIIGIATYDNDRVVYDIPKMVEITMMVLKCDEAEAWEYLEFNTFTAWVGSNTPSYIYPVTKEVGDE